MEALYTTGLEQGQSQAFTNLKGLVSKTQVRTCLHGAEMAFYLATGTNPNVDTTNHSNTENEKLKPDTKPGNKLSYWKSGGGVCELPWRSMDAYPFVKGGKELDVRLEVFSSFFKCFVIWKEKRGMKKRFHRQLICTEGTREEQTNYCKIHLDDGTMLLPPF